jgi:hypothetical protein
MKKRMTAKITILLTIFALVLVPVYASAQTQTPAAGAGAQGRRHGDNRYGCRSSRGGRFIGSQHSGNRWNRSRCGYSQELR